MPLDLHKSPLKRSEAENRYIVAARQQNTFNGQINEITPS